MSLLKKHVNVNVNVFFTKHIFVLPLSPFEAMETSKSKAFLDYAIDSSTAVEPTYDSSEESFEDVSSDIHHEASTATSNVIINIQPSQDAIFENSDKIHTPPSTPKKSGKNARTDNGSENSETEGAIAVRTGVGSHTTTGFHVRASDMSEPSVNNESSENAKVSQASATNGATFQDVTNEESFTKFDDITNHANVANDML